jgi:hypothetical protein
MLAKMRRSMIVETNITPRIMSQPYIEPNKKEMAGQSSAVKVGRYSLTNMIIVKINTAGSTRTKSMVG